MKLLNTYYLTTLDLNPPLLRKKRGRDIEKRLRLSLTLF